MDVTKAGPMVDSLPAKLSEGAKVFNRADTDEYRAHAYQYSTTSHQPGTMNPASVIYPANLADVVEVIKFARDNKIAIAVRTGGHQYSGASSTSGDNIQIDLSNTFMEFNYDESTDLVHCGISFALLELNTELRKRNLFIPHGQCAHVHVGGHVQTGGYGQLGRSHGLFCDHVQAFQIVTPDAQVRKVLKPHAGKTDNANNELFWAVLGGSPGSFGILTHVWIKPLHDKNYPNSRGMKLFSLYTLEKAQKCLQIMAEMSDNDNFPRDFDYCLTVMSDEMECWYFKNAFAQKFDSNTAATNVDQDMFFNHPEQYGDGVQTVIDGVKTKPPTPTGVIILYVQWANTGGKHQKFGEFETQWFKSIRDALKPDFVDAALQHFGKEEHVAQDLKRLFHGKSYDNEPDFNVLDWTVHTPMSTLTRYWVYTDVREYVMPYEKRTYITDKTDLATNGWSDWLAGRVNSVVKGPNHDLKIVIQIQPFGGKHSMYRKCSLDGTTSHSWRDQTTMCQVVDCFYKPKKGVAKLANDYQSGNDQEAGTANGKFCDKDRRVLWGSYARKSDPEGGASLDAVWDKYYDSKEKYDRLCKLKQHIDPDNVFTANAFGVHAKSAPLIKGVDH